MPSLRILLVDDDPIFLTLAELAIKKERSDVEIFKAFNGEEAIEFLSKQNVDAIYLDLNMPVMNGWEFLDACADKNQTKNKIFILTSSIDPSDKKRAEENPLVTIMLEKPLNKEKIERSLVLV